MLIPGRSVYNHITTWRYTLLEPFLWWYFAALVGFPSVIGQCAMLVRFDFNGVKHFRDAIDIWAYNTNETNRP
ncbi:hypothetical protein BV22DRAFT_404045 [Leucogyrophana mollusca]|uniref:Uncharacterized protein n=1 Tax=Leucogyrophana mollusca TaxID=85980 RepID=A0ACB8BIZ2_9AGAM|nr:hypothetical protein BV22DRAFT_404045 [Leucogyrophana mollusca]